VAGGSFIKPGKGAGKMKNQTTDKNLSAVLRDGLALEYVKEQTPEICLAAVRQNKCAVDLIRDIEAAKIIIDSGSDCSLVLIV